MATTQAWYSSQQRDVYHDNTACTEGNNIEYRYPPPAVPAACRSARAAGN